MVKYQNIQEFCECQLVSVWNACRFWGIDEQKIPHQFTKKYKAACDSANAVHGGVIGIDKQLKKYGVKMVGGELTLKWVREHLPVELSVFCHRGYHSVLVVKVDRCDMILTNYAWGRLYRMRWSHLAKIADKRIKPRQYIMRKK